MARMGRQAFTARQPGLNSIGAGSRASIAVTAVEMDDGRLVFLVEFEPDPGIADRFSRALAGTGPAPRREVVASVGSATAGTVDA